MAKGLLRELAVDVDELGAAYDQSFYKQHGLEVIYFDRDTYGRDVTRFTFFEQSLFLPLARSEVTAIDAVDQMPLSDEAKAQLKALFTPGKDPLPDHSVFAEPDFLSTITYQEFFTKDLGVTAPDAWQLVQNMGNSYFGFGVDLVPAFEALALGLPGLGNTSLGTSRGLIRRAIGWTTEPISIISQTVTHRWRVCSCAVSFRILHQGTI